MNDASKVNTLLSETDIFLQMTAKIDKLHTLFQVIEKKCPFNGTQ